MFRLKTFLGFDFFIYEISVKFTGSFISQIHNSKIIYFLFCFLFLNLSTCSQVHKRKRNKVLQCSLQMPMPPLPRVQPLPLQSEVPLTAAQRRERAFGATSVGKQSSGSTTSGNGAYEPLIELFIGTSSGRTRSNKKSEQYNSRKNEKRMEEQRR